MSSSVEQKKLWPLGQRVTHFDGGPSTHGKGTIVAYNIKKRISYADEKLPAALDIAGRIPGGLEVIADSFLDQTRCPYVVQWDPIVSLEFEGITAAMLALKRRIQEQYPEGYSDLYEEQSLTKIEGEPYEAEVILEIKVNGCLFSKRVVTVAITADDEVRNVLGKASNAALGSVSAASLRRVAAESMQAATRKGRKAEKLVAQVPQPTANGYQSNC